MAHHFNDPLLPRHLFEPACPKLAEARRREKERGEEEKHADEVNQGQSLSQNEQDSSAKDKSERLAKSISHLDRKSVV